MISSWHRGVNRISREIVLSFIVGIKIYVFNIIDILQTLL
jgi:hypothetical protein